MSGEAWRLGAAAAAEALASGTLTSEQLTRSVIDRIDETEPLVRAWAHVDRSGALETARASDARRRVGAALGPLDGVPIGVKDVVDVAGMPTRGGSASLADAVPAASDAGAVASARAAGVIVLGKTETYEFAFGQGDPPTRNPRDPQRYAGGSSIGSGVAVAVGSAPAALGTDTGGSVRNPAAVNGLVGIKPTRGLVAETGVIHVSDTMDAIGPIAPGVADAALLLDAISDPAVRASHGGTLAASGLANGDEFVVGVDRSLWEAWGVSGSVRAVTERALRRLLARGVRVVETEMPELDDALAVGLAISLAESVEHHRERLQARADLYLPETRVMIETGALITDADLAWAHRRRVEITTRLEDRLSGGIDAILAPTLPAIAPRLAVMRNQLTAAEDETGLGSALRMLASANVTGLPGLSVPGGVSDGQPVGIHLLGRPFAERDLIAIARRLEQSDTHRAEIPLTPQSGERALSNSG